MIPTRAAFVSVTIALLSSIPLHAQSREPLRFTFFALDRGEATLVEVPGGRKLLIGAGDVGEGKRVVELLKQRGVKRLDMLVIGTWIDRQVGGGIEVLKRVPTTQMFHSPIYVNSTANGKLFKYGKSLEPSNKFRVTSATPGHAQTLFYSPPCRMTAVGPTGEMLVEFAKDVNCSMILEFNFEKVAVLNLGASTAKHQRRLWETARVRPDGEVLILGRDGAADALLPSLLKPMGSRIAVIPVPRKSGRKPAPSTLAALRKAGVKTYRTDTQGTITISTDGREIQVETSR